MKRCGSASRATIASLVLVAACSGERTTEPAKRGGGGGGGAEACGPLRVVVDGEELSGLGEGYAYRTTRKTATVWHVERADGPPLSCEEMLRGGRAIRKGQHVVAADISSDRSYFTGVRLDGRSLTSWKPDTLVRLEGPPPAKVGDSLTICVDTRAVTDVAKGLEIRGALRGTYCGER
jgi:hypothetical protein